MVFTLRPRVISRYSKNSRLSFSMGIHPSILRKIFSWTARAERESIGIWNLERRKFQSSRAGWKWLALPRALSLQNGARMQLMHCKKWEFSHMSLPEPKYGQSNEFWS